MLIQRQAGDVRVRKARTEGFVGKARQVRENRGQVFLLELSGQPVVNAPVQTFGLQTGVQNIKLNYFLEIMKGAVENHLAEAGQMIMLKTIKIKRGQHLADIQKRIISRFTVRAQQTLFYLYKVQKDFKIMQSFYPSFTGKVIGLTGDQTAFFKKTFPGYSFFSAHVTREWW